MNHKPTSQVPARNLGPRSVSSHACNFMIYMRQDRLQVSSSYLVAASDSQMLFRLRLPFSATSVECGCPGPRTSGSPKLWRGAVVEAPDDGDKE